MELKDFWETWTKLNKLNEATKKGSKYKYLGEFSTYEVYEPLDARASIDLSAGTGWYTAGRSEHYGDYKFTPSLSDVAEIWEHNVLNGVRFFYLLDKKTLHGVYNIALYPEIFDFNDHYNNKIITNCEIADAKDNLIDYINFLNTFPISELEKLINQKIIIKYEKLNEFEINNTVLTKYNWQNTLVNIPNHITTIDSFAFNNCSSLTSIVIPNTVTSIGDYAFSGCSSLTSINIPNSVTKIGYGAFEGCSSLESITIPNSVTSIGSSAFYGCSSLKTIYCEAKSKPSNWNKNWNCDNVPVIWGHKI